MRLSLYALLFELFFFSTFIFGLLFLHPMLVNAYNDCSTVPTSGLFTIQPSKNGPKYRVYCDIVTTGGPWMLLLAYHHNGGENMDLVENSIPISPTDGYSHVFLNQFKDASGNNVFSAKAVRFYCESSNEQPKIHFYSFDTHTLRMTSTSLSMDNLEPHLNSRTIELPGHDFINNDYHWSIRAQGSKWECNANNNDYSQATLHQIWVNVNNVNTNNVNNNINTNIKVKRNQLTSKKSKMNSQAATKEAVTMSLNGYTPNWYETASPDDYWYTIVTSNTGQYVYAGETNRNNGNMIYSSNYGESWDISDAPSAYWYASACSNSGQYVYTAGYVTSIYRSTNYGINWSASTTSPTAKWYGMTTSASGQYVYAGLENGYIQVSSDYGDTFASATNSASGTYYALTTIASGATVYAGKDNGRIYTSTDYGATWTVMSNSPISYWNDLATFNDGQYVYGRKVYSMVLQSSNYGADWTAMSTPLYGWSSVEVSDDGQYVFASQDHGYIYYSVDSGVTWMQSNAPYNYWYNIACSDNGKYVYGAVDNGFIY
eukprot:gene10661-22254_t